MKQNLSGILINVIRKDVLGIAVHILLTLIRSITKGISWNWTIVDIKPLTSCSVGCVKGGIPLSLQLHFNVACLCTIWKIVSRQKSSLTLLRCYWSLYDVVTVNVLRFFCLTFDGFCFVTGKTWRSRFEKTCLRRCATGKHWYQSAQLQRQARVLNQCDVRALDTQQRKWKPKIFYPSNNDTNKENSQIST